MPCSVDVYVTLTSLPPMLHPVRDADSETWSSFHTWYPLVCFILNLSNWNIATGNQSSSLYANFWIKCYLMASGENVCSAGIILKLTFKVFSVVKFVLQHFLGSRMGLIPFLSDMYVYKYIYIFIYNIILPGRVDSIYIFMENKFHVWIIGHDCCSGKHDYLACCF